MIYRPRKLAAGANLALGEWQKVKPSGEKWWQFSPRTSVKPKLNKEQLVKRRLGPKSAPWCTFMKFKLILIKFEANFRVDA
jgi:hypothetical protein